MKITFKNLGAIKETELDLRPLTIIIGPNNSNKTYVAYSTYGIWKEANGVNVLLQDFGSWGVLGNLQVTLNQEAFKLNVDDFTRTVRQLGQRSLDAFARNLDVFYQDTSHQLFANTGFEVSVSDDEIKAALANLTRRGLYTPAGHYVLSLEGDLLVVRPDVDPRGPIQPADTDVRFGLVFNLMQELFSRPFLLPAERNAFIITYKMLAYRRYNLLREGQRQLIRGRADQERMLDLLREQGDIRYPQPIEDFLEFLTGIELENGPMLDAEKESAGNASGAGRNHRNRGLAEIASQVERYIQNDHKTRFKPTKFGGQEIMVDIQEDFQIDLYNASSSIKQLAPLLLYLRYRASENDLLIIDEPEMNLHPESQVRLLEILAILVNSGVKVLLTTHSPYLMAHLNNLVQSEDRPAAVRKRQASALYLHDPRAFLSMDQVSAYEMKDFRLQSLKDEDYGIRWDTLSDVSVEVQQKYFEIHDKGKVRARGKAE